MIKLLWSGFIIMLLLSGCGWNGTPTRNNDFIPLSSIEIIDTSPSIAAHTSTRLSVKGNFTGLYPSRDITDQAVWSSDSPSVADFITATEPNRVTGRVPGTAILTATVRGVSATFKLTVSPAAIKTITITPASPTIVKGLTTQFAATGTFSDNTTQDLTFDATWTSSIFSVATVSDSASNKGSAQALAVGTSVITASFDGVSGTSLLTVSAPELLSVAISPVSMDLTAGSAKRFTVAANFSDGTTQDVTASCDWTSSDETKAKVGTSGLEKGLVTGVAAGSATISAVYGNKPPVTATVTVSTKTLESLALNAITVTLTSGTQATFTAKANYSDGSSQDVTDTATWTINNLFVAILVDAQNLPGQIQAVSSGSTILTASFGGKTQTATVIVP